MSERGHPPLLGCAALACFLTWLIIWHQAAEGRTVLPVKGEVPFLTENVRIKDSAVKENSCLFADNGLPLGPSETCNLRCGTARTAVRTNYGAFNRSAEQHNGASNSRVFMDQLSTETVDDCGGFPEIFKLVFNKQSADAHYVVLAKFVQAIGYIDADDAGINVSALDNGQSIGGFFGYISGPLSGPSGADGGASGKPHLRSGSPHVASLHDEGYQLKEKDKKGYDADRYLIASVFDNLFIVRNLKSRLCGLFVGLGLLFGGGYNIYRERLVWGSALFASGALLGFWGVFPNGWLL
jgi:hypothetical protein